ncbi:DUF3549 family protein [Psychromonas sp. 14N.309.X.WAT.B.A12]|uniref:DUF3549 family protein n=1 Tax=Psychromonas sp. 14N.309.X.WAT.B.A12 TaxID=2998322 RepID=UPI0025AF7244|nr:DUF3549 family protein [Psychromonas sp. 14N.309.X.WAT.B.A12]MDN2663777.1 DUF3549 family protein [Psychromonas sp. 14N.309.X.WAT.B.A12]
MSMNTLTDFLEQAQCQSRVYDLGRIVQKIDNSEFQKVANNEQAYPYPIQQHAFLAITFWQVAAQKEHFVWFLKMPLDEQGLMKITAQTSFIRMVVEAMGENLTADVSDKTQERLASNPFVFKPSAEKLAIFNANMNSVFVRPASSFYPAVQAYFSGSIDNQDWQTLGFQGFADIAARLDYDDNQKKIIAALPTLPEQPLQTLCLCLENQTNISTELVEKIIEQAKQRLHNGQITTAILLLRAIASANAQGLTKQLLETQFSSELLHNADWYITIAGRCWTQLQNETLLNRYFEALATHQQALFPQLFADLVAIPALRDKVLKQLRLTARSPALSQAIGLLFSGLKPTT